MGPSKMAKGAVAALAASAADGSRLMGQGISPSEGTAAYTTTIKIGREYHDVKIFTQVDTSSKTTSPRPRSD